MKIIAVIPARAGSVRLPNKNIKKLNGIPLITRTIQFAKKLKFINDIVVSTNDPSIIKMNKYNKSIKTFNRPKNLSKDNTSTASVISHAIKFLSDKIDFTHVCCIYPMAILIGKNDLLKAKQIIKKKNEIIFPALKYSHPIQRAFKIIDFIFVWI